MRTIWRMTILPIRFAVSSLDVALSAGGFHNARIAAQDSALRRTAWTESQSILRGGEEGSSAA